MKKERPLGMKYILMLCREGKHEGMLQGEAEGVKHKEMKRMAEEGFKLSPLMFLRDN